jgi:hypothetical protein
MTAGYQGLALHSAPERLTRVPPIHTRAIPEQPKSSIADLDKDIAEKREEAGLAKEVSDMEGSIADSLNRILTANTSVTNITDGMTRCSATAFQ